MNRQSGFTLVEMAIVLVVSGLIMGGSMMLMKPYVEGAKINATKEKLNKISDALAMFEQTYGRLPCPAQVVTAGEPFGAPIQSGTDGTNFVTQGCGATGIAQGTVPTNYVGIVPFKALGLTEDNVRDAYGNLITYAVSVVLAQRIDTTTSQKVHKLCSTTQWIDPVTASDNLNAPKARFCCPYFWTAAADLKVQDSLGNTLFTGQHSTNTGADYVSAASSSSSAVTPTNTDAKLIAFVLVSHGKNGDGAYVKQQAGVTITQNPVTVNAGAQESENRNGDMTFKDEPISLTNDTNYFDDIVVWQTNDQIISAFGTDSCGRP